MVTVISNFTLFEKNNGFKAVVAISQNFLWNRNHSIELNENRYFHKNKSDLTFLNSTLPL